MKNRIRLTLLLLCAVISLAAQGQTTHWTCDAYSYQYDMTAYMALSINGEPLTDLRGCEIAAFCGDECRGVSEIMSVERNGETVLYAYLRIRSNQSEGENITFKVFMSAMNEEFEVKDVSISFQSQQVLSLPSNPTVLDIDIEFMRGDTNGDWRISIADAVAVVDYILSDGTTPLIVPAADMDGNGRISIADAVAIVDYILTH